MAGGESGQAAPPPDGRAAMLGIARNCELMAERAERLAARKQMDGAEKTGSRTD
jgi:hypothetical protein